MPSWTPNSRPTAATTRIPCGRSIAWPTPTAPPAGSTRRCAGSSLAAAGSARRHGPDHLETLRYRSSLANCHYAAGHTDVAIEMFGALFEARCAALGEEHPDTLRSRGSLANALHAVGRYDEAATLHLRNAGDRAETLGRQHPSTEASLRNLARAVRDAGADTT